MHRQSQRGLDDVGHGRGAGGPLEKVCHYRLEGGNSPLDADTIERCFRVVRWTMALVVCYVILLIGVLQVCFA